MMNINELLNKANEVIAEANEEIKEEVKIELMVDECESTKGKFDEVLKEKIDLIKELEGIHINKMGVWLWVEGDTIKVKEELKNAGFKYASKKKMWYFNPDELYQKKSKWTTSKKRIIELYGIEEIK